MSRPAVLAEFPSQAVGQAQHGDYPNDSDAVRYLGNEVPHAQGLLNVVLFLSADRH